MRVIALAFTLVGVTACELPGPEDKRRDGETFAEAEARHAAEREVKLEARHDGDGVLVDYRGWLPCDGRYALRPEGHDDDTLRLVVEETSASNGQTTCLGPVDLQVRLPFSPRGPRAVRVVQHRPNVQREALIR
jgi:hypothetical protein